MKEALAKYAIEKHNVKLTIKYLDPMYAIRTTKANTEDTVMCSYDPLSNANFDVENLGTQLSMELCAVLLTSLLVSCVMSLFTYQLTF